MSTVSVDGQDIRVALDAEVAARERYLDLRARYLQTFSEHEVEKLRDAAQKYCECSVEVHKVMRIDEILANPIGLR